MPAWKTRLLGSGSANGVDASRFDSSGPRLAGAQRARRSLGLPDQVPIVGFVGRLTRDKGIVELIEAFQALERRFSGMRLLLVGGLEKADPLPPWVEASIRTHSCIVHTGFVGDPALLYQLMDVVVLPSYREGFPTVALEAAAAGKPIVATRVTGTEDAVVDGETGLLTPARDSCSLAAAIAALLDDKTRADRIGLAARRRVVREFPQERVWEGLLALYQETLEARGSIGQSSRDTRSLVFNGAARVSKRLPAAGAAPALVRTLMGSLRAWRRRAAGAVFANRG